MERQELILSFQASTLGGIDSSAVAPANAEKREPRVIVDIDRSDRHAFQVVNPSVVFRLLVPPSVHDPLVW